MATTTLRSGATAERSACFGIAHPFGDLRIVALHGAGTFDRSEGTAMTALMRRHREHGSGKHGENHQQTADKIERHGEVGNGTTIPIKRNRAGLAIAEINQRHGIAGILRRRFLDPHIHRTRAALHGTPHVGILERSLIRGGIGIALRRGTSCGQRGPIGQTGDTRVLGTGDPAGDVTRGAQCDADFGFRVL